MTTEWWNMPVNPSAEADRPVIAEGWQPSPTTAPAPPEPRRREGPEVPQKKDRRKSLALGAAGAAVVGAILFAAIPDGGSGGVTPSAPRGDFLPPAGGGPTELAEEPPARQGTVRSVVTLTAVPAGRGEVGVLVEVTIRNDTEDAMTIMPSMMKGDGNSAMVGEGTLAPGSRRIEPGETVAGTIEFAAGEAPAQIVLTDLSGNVVAASR